MSSSGLPKDTQEAKNMASDAVHNTQQKAEDISQDLSNKGAQLSHDASKKADEAKNSGSSTTGDGSITDSAKNAMQGGADFISKKAEEVKDYLSK